MKVLLSRAVRPRTYRNMINAVNEVTRERAFSYLTDDLRRSMDAVFAMLESDR